VGSNWPARIARADERSDPADGQVEACSACWARTAEAGDRTERLRRLARARDADPAIPLLERMQVEGDELVAHLVARDAALSSFTTKGTCE